MKLKFTSHSLHALYLCTFFFFLQKAGTAQWIQRGIDVDGEASLTWYGYSVGISADGNVFIGGAMGSDIGGNDIGNARVFYWNGSAWIQRGNALQGEAAGDQAGWGVSISGDGNTVAVGALNNDGNGSNSGHARIYEWNGSAWTQKGNDIDGEAAGDQSAADVSLNSDGNVVAIGARENDGNGTAAGHVRVYTWSGSGWLQQGNDIEGEDAGDYSGQTVSLSADGNTVAIGAPSDDDNGMDAGQVRVYEWTGTWTQKGGDIDGDAGDWSGFAIGLSNDGNTVVIGSPANSDSALYSGKARAYMWNGDQWVQKGSDIPGLAIEEYQFGWSVSINGDGNVIAVGADLAGWGYGFVRVYMWNGSDWLQINQLLDTDQPGFEVSLDSIGNTVAIGSRLDNNLSGTAAGHVRVYDNDFSTAILRNSSSLFSVYPNPCSNILHVSAKEKNAVIGIYDLSGRLCFETQIESNLTDIDISTLSEGLFFANIKAANGATSRIKLVKE
jgi:hypothetical protein